VYPIALCERDALTQFMSAIHAPVNVSRMPQLPSLEDVSALGVARVSWAIGLFEQAMANFREQLASIRS
jgi:2-methylisocitrate lyase-like PEP mutase family enzyme